MDKVIKMYAILICIVMLLFFIFAILPILICIFSKKETEKITKIDEVGELKRALKIAKDKIKKLESYNELQELDFTVKNKRYVELFKENIKLENDLNFYKDRYFELLNRTENKKIVKNTFYEEFENSESYQFFLNSIIAKYHLKKKHDYYSKISFEYKDRFKNLSFRFIEVKTVIVTENNIYLDAFCHLRQNSRLFCIKRIISNLTMENGKDIAISNWIEELNFRGLILHYNYVNSNRKYSN